MTAVFEYPSIYSEERTVALDEDQLSLEDITLPASIKIPAINEQGQVQMVTSEELETRSLNNIKNKYNMNLISNQCAILN